MKLFAVITLACLLSTSCSKSPEETKREAFARGQAFAQSQQFAQAIIEYRRALQADTRFGAARKELAKAYLEAGDVSNALRESIRAADLLPDDLDVQIHAGNLLLAMGQFEDARSRAESTLKKFPDSVPAHVLRGNALAGLRDVDAALTEFEKAATASPDAGEIQSNIAAVQMARGAREDADAAFRKATELSPDSVMARVAYAQFLLATSRPEAAEAELQHAVDAAPEDPLARRALAMLYLSADRADEAEPHLRKLADVSGDSWTRFALARYYFALKRRDEGFRELQALAAKPETYVDATLQIASAKYAEGQSAEAHHLLEEVQRKFPTNPRASLVSAEFLASERKWPEAITAAQAAADRDPRLAEAFYVLGLAQQGRRDFEAAKKAFGEVLRLQPSATRAQVALANLHLMLGDNNTAQQLAVAAAAQAPGTLEVRETLVRAMLANGDLGAAEKAIAALKADFPERDTPYILEGTARFTGKDFVGAERAFIKAADITPTSVPAASGRVQVMLATGRGSEAKQFVDRLTLSKSGEPDYLILAARTYSTLQDFGPAERMLRRVLEIDPSRTETYSLLAQLYSLQNRLDDALREYQNLASRQTKSVTTHTMIGTILQTRNRRLEAKAAYRTALSIDARAPVAANNLAWLMAEDGEDLDVALQLAQTAKAGLPNSADTSDTLGVVYMKKGFTGRAIAEFRQAVAKQPDKAEFKYRLGVAYAENGDLSEARRTLEAALAQNPRSAQATDARVVLARLARIGS